jgi:hypothetical protein
MGLPRLGPAAVPFPENPGERPAAPPPGVSIRNPFGGRIPASFVIDDSTCLVNMGHYCMPQFEEAWGRKEYNVPWRTWPREIPDDFVRKFGDFCRSEGVKGKYSIVPYPAMVGWVDREMPGWSRRELVASRNLVRDFMMRDWDIHPEMISHTRVINTQTGRPLPRRPDRGYWMENGGWCEGRSVDEIADYIAYALRILKQAELPCEGFTTPGGFGNPAKDFLEAAGLDAVRSVFPETEIPHYFKYVLTDPNESLVPRVERAKGISGGSPECIVNIPTCTGDWFGRWHGGAPNPTEETIDRHILGDLSGGRMVEAIENEEPAVFLTHWPSLYSNGNDIAFAAFRGIVERLNRGYGERLLWMKLSEIARYWAAKELTAVTPSDAGFQLDTPWAAPGFTMRVPATSPHVDLRLIAKGTEPATLNRVEGGIGLKSGTFRRVDDEWEICFSLPKGRSGLRLTKAAG